MQIDIPCRWDNSFGDMTWYYLCNFQKEARSTTLTLYFAMLQNGETHLKNLAANANAARFLKCLTILRHCEVKG